MILYVFNFPGFNRKDNIMKCQNKSSCEGVLDGAKTVPIRVSCTRFDEGLVCPVCRRVHYINGKPVYNRQDMRVFNEGDEMVCQDENGVVCGRFPVGI